MNYTRNEIKAGLMVIGSGILFILFIVIISGLEITRSMKNYTIFLKHTGGVVVGSLVRYGGMEIGKVTRVEISDKDNSFIEIDVKIDEKAPVKTDSEACLSAVGLLGDYYIEISAGSPEAPELPSGSIIKSRETTQFTQLTQPVEEISARLQVLIDRFNDLINDQSRQHVASMIASLDTLLTGNVQNINEIMNNLNATTADFQKISFNLNRLIENNDLKIDSTWNMINQTVLELHQLALQLQTATAHLNQVVQARDENLAAILEKVEQTTDNLEKFSKIIKDQPWSLIRKSAPPPRPLP